MPSLQVTRYSYSWPGMTMAAQVSMPSLQVTRYFYSWPGMPMATQVGIPSSYSCPGMPAAQVDFDPPEATTARHRGSGNPGPSIIPEFEPPEAITVSHRLKNPVQDFKLPEARTRGQAGSNDSSAGPQTGVVLPNGVVPNRGGPTERARKEEIRSSENPKFSDFRRNCRKNNFL